MPTCLVLLTLTFLDSFLIILQVQHQVPMFDIFWRPFYVKKKLYVYMVLPRVEMYEPRSRASKMPLPPTVWHALVNDELTNCSRTAFMGHVASKLQPRVEVWYISRASRYGNVRKISASGGANTFRESKRPKRLDIAFSSVATGELDVILVLQQVSLM